MTNLGTMLKQAREDAGMTVAEVADITKIRPSFITDLENHRFGGLPPQVYVIGFLRNLGRAYKTDSEALVIAYREEMARNLVEQEEKQQVDTQNKEAYIRDKAKRVEKERNPVERGSVERGKGPAARKPVSVREENEREDEVLSSLSRSAQNRKQLKGFLVSILLVGFIALFVYGLWYFNDGAEQPPEEPPISGEDPNGLPEPDVQEPQEPTVPQEPGNGDDLYEPDTYQYLSPNVIAEGLDIMVRVQENGDYLSWVRAIVDGQRVYEGNLQAGEVIRLYAQDSINIRIGDAGVVELYQDGLMLPFEGQRGAVLDRTFAR